jgi:hypothetical protein
LQEKTLLLNVVERLDHNLDLRRYTLGMHLLLLSSLSLPPFFGHRMCASMLFNLSQARDLHLPLIESALFSFLVACTSAKDEVEWYALDCLNEFARNEDPNVVQALNKRKVCTQFPDYLLHFI